MDKNTLVKVTNRDTGVVGYSLPELGIMRQFQPRETKEIKFGELETLTWQPGGIELLQEYLVIRDEEAAKVLLRRIEPEYYYTNVDVKRILNEASYDEFLDCLDFAPDGVKEMIKDMAVSLPLYDSRKREAIFEKLGFNVTKAIEIQKTKYDGGDDDTSATATTKTRRVATSDTNKSDAPVRRAEAPKSKYTVIKSE